MINYIREESHKHPLLTGISLAALIGVSGVNAFMGDDHADASFGDKVTTAICSAETTPHTVSVGEGMLDILELVDTDPNDFVKETPDQPKVSTPYARAIIHVILRGNDRRSTEDIMTSSTIDPTPALTENGRELNIPNSCEPLDLIQPDTK